MLEHGLLGGSRAGHPGIAGRQMTEPAVIPTMYALCAAVGFFFGLAVGLRWPLPKPTCEGGTGRPEDADLATPAPQWAAEKILMLDDNRSGRRSVLEKYFADAGKKGEGR
jgi:hypothetical protein